MMCQLPLRHIQLNRQRLQRQLQHHRLWVLPNLHHRCKRCTNTPMNLLRKFALLCLSAIQLVLTHQHQQQRCHLGLERKLHRRIRALLLDFSTPANVFEPIQTRRAPHRHLPQLQPIRFYLHLHLLQCCRRRHLLLPLLQQHRHRPALVVRHVRFSRLKSLLPNPRLDEAKVNVRPVLSLVHMLCWGLALHKTGENFYFEPQLARVFHLNFPVTNASLITNRRCMLHLTIQHRSQTLMHS